MNPMIERVMSADGKQDMSRNELVRANFEVQRHLHWVATLEPRFRRHNVNRDAMRHYREAWNVFSEDRDWGWWRDEARYSSNEKLKAEIAECMAELKAIETRDLARDQADAVRQPFKEILGGDDRQQSAEPAHSLNRSKERCNRRYGISIPKW